MGKRCALKNCGNNDQAGFDVTFHRLPQNEEFRKKWLDAIPTDLMEMNTKMICICSSHFTKDNFQPVSLGLSRRMLKKTAVPSLFRDNLTPEARRPKILEITNIPAYNEEVGNFITCKTEPQEEFFESTTQDKETQTTSFTQDSQAQTSPKRLQASQSDREIELLNKVRMLKKRLNRREQRITTMKHFMQYLKSSKKELLLQLR